VTTTGDQLQLCLWENVNLRDVGIHVFLWTGVIDVGGLSKKKVEGGWQMLRYVEQS
jgi:hypothetical protein